MMIPETSNPTIDRSDSKAAAEKELDDKLNEMRELKTNMELNARAIGERVNQIRDGKLWRNAGYNSADHCFKSKFKEIGSRATLYRFGDIARRFTDNDVRQLG